MRRGSLKHLAGRGFAGGNGTRRLVGAVLLLGVAALAARSADVLSRKHGTKQWYVPLGEPLSLYERFRDAGLRGPEERFAFYQLARRFAGGRVFLPRRIAERHGWYLERVSRLDVEVASGLARLEPEDRDLADFVGRLEGRMVYFFAGAGGDYELLEGDAEELFWVPRRSTGDAP